MRTPRSLWLLWIPGLVLLCAVGWVIQWRQEPQVSWKGKPSAYWIGRLNHFDLDGGYASAEEFLFAAGPGVVPVLIRGLDTRDSRIADAWYDLYFKLGSWQRFLAMPVRPASYRANCARGLGLLGPAASNAVPALLRTLQDRNPEVRRAAVGSLARISADPVRVVPELIRGLSNTDPNHRLACVIGLTHVVGENPDVARSLRSVLADPDSNLRSWAAGSLWRDASDPPATFAALSGALSDTNAAVRSRAAHGLGKMRYHLPEAAGALISALEGALHSGEEGLFLWRLLGALAELGPNAREAVPLLTHLSQTNSHEGMLAIIALGRIEPLNPDWVQGLVTELGDTRSGRAFWAALKLGNLGAIARSSVPSLLQLAKSTPDPLLKAVAAASAWRLDPTAPDPFGAIEACQIGPGRRPASDVVRLLGEMGPAARPAVPVLRRLLYCHGPTIHDEALEALGAIAPEVPANPWSP